MKATTSIQDMCPPLLAIVRAFMGGCRFFFLVHLEILLVSIKLAANAGRGKYGTLQKTRSACLTSSPNNPGRGKRLNCSLTSDLVVTGWILTS